MAVMQLLQITRQCPRHQAPRDAVVTRLSRGCHAARVSWHRDAGPGGAVAGSGAVLALPDSEEGASVASGPSLHIGSGLHTRPWSQLLLICPAPAPPRPARPSQPRLRCTVVLSNFNIDLHQIFTMFGEGTYQHQASPSCCWKCIIAISHFRIYKDNIKYQE